MGAGQDLDLDTSAGRFYWGTRFWLGLSSETGVSGFFQVEPQRGLNSCGFFIGVSERLQAQNLDSWAKKAKARLNQHLGSAASHIPGRNLRNVRPYPSWCPSWSGAAVTPVCCSPLRSVTLMNKLRLSRSRPAVRKSLTVRQSLITPHLGRDSTGKVAARAGGPGNKGEAICGAAAAARRSREKWDQRLSEQEQRQDI